MSSRQVQTLSEAIAAAIVLAVKGVFYGTIAFVIIHFIIKFW